MKIQKTHTTLTMSAYRMIDDEMTRTKIITFEDSSFPPYLDTNK
jgi:hypothetical protein